MWGIGSRIQPLALSKELQPVGSRRDGETERPRAGSEYLIKRMARGGARKIVCLILTGKFDILEYCGGRVFSADVCYVVQPEPAGLCDAVFRALSLVPTADHVVVG
jgi:glucose-1-phosphate thymidylyltransferase